MRLTPSKLAIFTLALATTALWTNIWLESRQQAEEAGLQATLKEATWQFSNTQIWRPAQKDDTSTLNFTAEQIRYQQNQQASHLNSLVLIDYRQNSLNLISSQQGIIDSEQNISLDQNVKFSHYEAQKEKPPGWQQQIQLSGEQFTYNSQQRQLTGLQPVTLTQPYAVTQAGGLKADLANGEWLFTDGVKGTISPQSINDGAGSAGN